MSILIPSREGVAFLERHEGVVLKAYRDVAGVWTIGAGLTAASGVVAPQAGMVITAEEASRLLALALTRNYAPEPLHVMPAAKQHEFDGALSFHFNTGAIGRASGSRRGGRGTRRGRKGLAKWVKGGRKVPPGLQRRRKEEADPITYGVDRLLHRLAEAPAGGGADRPEALGRGKPAAARAGFRTLGYDPGDDPLVDDPGGRGGLPARPRPGRRRHCRPRHTLDAAAPSRRSQDVRPDRRGRWRPVPSRTRRRGSARPSPAR